MTRTMAVALSTCTLMACGGSGGKPSGKVCEGANTTPPELAADYGGSFEGRWVGVLTTELDGEPSVDLVALDIDAHGENSLTTDICQGLPALVTSPASFDTVCFICPPVDVPGVCGSMVMTYTGGAGTLSSEGSVLDVEVEGTMEGCGYSFAVRQTFADATRSSALREGTAGDGATPRFADFLREHLAGAR